MNQVGIHSLCLLNFNMVKTPREHRGACHQPKRTAKESPLLTSSCHPSLSRPPSQFVLLLYTTNGKLFTCKSFHKINIKSSCPNHHNFFLMILVLGLNPGPHTCIGFDICVLHLQSLDFKNALTTASTTKYCPLGFLFYMNQKHSGSVGMSGRLVPGCANQLINRPPKIQHKGLWVG